MHTFFHGWRRKTGVVTLVMACVLAISWIRSLIYYEQVWCDFFGSTIWLSHYDRRIHIVQTKTSSPNDRGAQSIPLQQYGREFDSDVDPFWRCWRLQYYYSTLGSYRTSHHTFRLPNPPEA